MKWKFNNKIGFIGKGLKLKLTSLTVCQAVGKLLVHTGAVILRSDSIRTALLVLLNIPALCDIWRHVGSYMYAVLGR